MDSIRIYTELSDATDGAAKRIIPGRSPWATRSDARRWLSAEYADYCARMADDYGVTVHAIKVRGPGVAPFLPGVSAKFTDAEKRHTMAR